MNNILNLSTRRLIVIGGIIAFGLLVWLTVWLLSFRVTSIDPSSRVSNTISQISFHFSRDLSEETLSGIEISPEVNGAKIIDKNTFVFKPTSDIQKGTLTFTFTDITATDGSVIDRFEKEFIVDYVPYNELSKEEQKRQVDQSSGGQDRFDILNGYLPHASYNYTLDYLEPLPDEKTLALTIDIYGKGENESQQNYIDRMEQARKDVLKYINEHKGKNSIDDFQLFYNDPYLMRYNTLQNDVDHTHPGG